MGSLVSVFTPCCNSTFIKRAYESLLAQTHGEWEWVIYLNGAAKEETLVHLLDPRVKIFRGEVTGGCGCTKLEATKRCSGEYLVEFDSDDELLPACLEEIVKAGADFAYSNSVLVSETGGEPWSAVYGWHYRDFEWRGKSYKEAICPIEHPANWALIYYAPNHVRAWRTSFYWQIGGYDPGLHLADDHDLMCRTYIAQGKLAHIDKPLYLYYMHSNNTCMVRNDEVQRNQWANYRRFLEPMSARWAELNGLRKIDLGGGRDKAPGFESYDMAGSDIIGNLEDSWRLEDNSVGVLRAYDILEHLRDPIHTMNEAYRVLAPNGLFLIMVPDARGQGGFCDPTHCSFWVPRSFRYYTEPRMQRYLPKCVCKFQALNISEVTRHDDRVPYVAAHLVAIKGGERVHGINLWEQAR